MHLRTALRLTAACLLLIAATVQAQQSKPRSIVVVDRIVAVVNDEVITERELAARVDFALRQLAQQGTQPPARQVLERQLLERTIN
ncbi:MAG: molecular chaperone SurA, partial [Burkholderiales bacterium]